MLLNASDHLAAKSWNFPPGKLEGMCRSEGKTSTRKAPVHDQLHRNTEIDPMPTWFGSQIEVIICVFNQLNEGIILFLDLDTIR